MRFKTYKKEYDYSYTLGLYPTIELVRHKPAQVEMLIFAEAAEKSQAARELRQRCLASGITCLTDDKQVAYLGKNGSSLVVGVFSKWRDTLSSDDSHIVLVEPDDMGNIGTILRSMLGFGYHDLAIIGPAADYWHPKCIRASMGALFTQRVMRFETIEEYRQAFSAHVLNPFMLDGAEALSQKNLAPLHSLIFGNEGAGLPMRYRTLGEPIVIEQESTIDSLNVAAAVSVAMYAAYSRCLG